MKYEYEVRNCLKKYHTIAENIDEISIDMDLRSIGLDSLTFISLIADIEDLFAIEFSIEKLVMDEMATIRRLCDAISECIL